MRVLAGFVLVGWLSAGTAATCLAIDACTATTEHQCCCGHAEACSCRLSMRHSPAPLCGMAAAKGAPDEQGMPQAAVETPVCAVTLAAQASRQAAAPTARTLPLYVFLHAIRR
jgi:hypothetical protein